MINYLSPLALSLYLGITASISAIILFIQFGYHSILRQNKKDTDNILIKYDQERDLKVPFSDTHRIPRLIFGTFVLFLISIYTLYDQVRIFSNNNNSNEDLIQNVIAASIVLITWLYALTLTFISKKHQLPNQKGFIINIHLFIIYAVGFIISIHDTWSLVTTQPNMTWLNALPVVLRMLFTSDLVYTTITASRGAPFIDLKGRSVDSVNVASIWSFLLFTWIGPLVRLAYKKKDLTDDDLPALAPHYRGYNLFYLFSKYPHSKLAYRIYRANRLTIIIQVILAIIVALLNYAPSYFISRILNLIQDASTGKKDDQFIENSILIITGLGVSMLAYSTVNNQLSYLSK